MYYFAYGSNLKESRMKEGKHNIRILQKQRVVLHDYILKGNIISDSYKDQNNPEKKYAVANITPEQGSNVEGILYEIENDDIEILDEWESWYIRQEIVVISTSSMAITAFAYIGKKERQMEGIYFHYEYFKIIIEGATNPSMSLSEEYIDFLKTMRPIAIRKH